MAIGSATLGAAEPFLIQQDWSAYTPEQHATWAELVGRRMPQIEAYACEEYLQGFEQIGLRADLIPNLADVNQRLRPRSGWRATPVSGFLPPDAFFAMLAARQFPTTTWLRSRESLAYIPEPDIFHDVFGHVPMHAHPVFADFLQHYGVVCAALTDKDALEKMGRLFWFTVEFGVIRQKGGYRLYGSGLISSQGESTYVIEGRPEIKDFDVDQVLNQEFSTSEMQPVLYAVDSFEQIYEATRRSREAALPVGHPAANLLVFSSNCHDPWCTIFVQEGFLAAHPFSAAARSTQRQIAGHGCALPASGESPRWMPICSGMPGYASMCGRTRPPSTRHSAKWTRWPTNYWLRNSRWPSICALFWR